MEAKNEIPKQNSTELEAKIIVLSKEKAILNTENTELKAKLKALGGFDDICRYCRKPKGVFLSIDRSKEFPSFDMKAKFYRCENCGQEYERPHINSH